MLFAGFAVADPGASTAHHRLTLLGIVAAGVLGNLLGSWLSYAVGRAGRLELVERHGRWLHIQPRHIEWADRWFARYGSSAIFFSRVLPIIRTFISLPAGVARVPFARFTALTLAGCVPWVLGLALAGEAVGSEWRDVRKSLEYVDYALLALVAGVVVYAIARRRRRSASSAASDQGAGDAPGSADSR
jgi:membrane protein DedA with SNARE-associated domain